MRVVAMGDYSSDSNCESTLAQMLNQQTDFELTRP